MKTIIVPTDFSAQANNAANYALHLAGVMGADLKLCHAFKVPAEAFMAADVVWPLEDHDTVKKEIDRDLKLLADTLTDYHQNQITDALREPKVSGTSAIGEVTDIVRTLAADAGCRLVVMGMSGAGAVQKLFFGSNSKTMIDVTEGPLLLVPANSFFHGIKKIAFATDLKSADIQVICSLASFAKYFNAEIMLCHITDEKVDTGERQALVDAFLLQVTNKINYNKIYYRHIKAADVSQGLTSIYEHGLVDMLAISHGLHNFTDSLLGFGSFTQKLARHINIPLLVYPKDIRSAALIVF